MILILPCRRYCGQHNDRLRSKRPFLPEEPDADGNDSGRLRSANPFRIRSLPCAPVRYGSKKIKASKRIKARLSSVAKGDVKPLTVPASRETSFGWLPPFTQHLGATVDSTEDWV